MRAAGRSSSVPVLLALYSQLDDLRVSYLLQSREVPTEPGAASAQLDDLERQECRQRTRLESRGSRRRSSGGAPDTGASGSAQ